MESVLNNTVNLGDEALSFLGSNGIRFVNNKGQTAQLLGEASICREGDGEVMNESVKPEDCAFLGSRNEYQEGLRSSLPRQLGLYMGLQFAGISKASLICSCNSPPLSLSNERASETR